MKTIYDLETGEDRRVLSVSRDAYFQIRQQIENEFKTEMNRFVFLSENARPERLDLGSFILEIDPQRQ